ncbi:hypothetical protein LMG1866_01979 [Achromobacter ruhlandii]|uniref:hypothetical protein n=1 Tax=Achromobacter ruhlandii TaxID=72557 RepID=UPI00146986B5|nr:hypothetical protein [Achromobacter ruhlandii]CAB3689362.1 hypothetical protein LMG1866_01979 [Achromobacter ruhlandii]
MPTPYRRFLDHLAARGWTVTAPTAATAPPAFAGAYAPFSAMFDALSNAAGTRWFLSARDYAGDAGDDFPWDALRQISLDAALDAAERQAVQAFWTRHAPIYLSVDGDYEFLAIDRESGRIVHGVEPEFEDTTPVAASLDALFLDMMAGGATAALLGPPADPGAAPAGVEEIALRPCTHDAVAAREGWLDCAQADGGRLRLVLPTVDAREAAALLARARVIAQSLAARRDAALRFLWQAGRQAGDPEQAPAAFMEGFAPSDLVVAPDGGYVLHLAPRDATWFMAGYWPSVRFTDGDAPAGWTCEA